MQVGELEMGWYQRQREDWLRDQRSRHPRWLFGVREPWNSAVHHDPGDEDRSER